VSYQPFSRADRNRLRRGESPRRALHLTTTVEASWRLIDAVLACDGIEPIHVEMACDYTPPEVEAARMEAREAFTLRWGAP